MRLYGRIEKVQPLDDGTIMVHGIASTEDVDSAGEIVRADAMRAALPEFLRFPAIREMHQLSAAGTAVEAEVGDDGVTRIVAHVVDANAILKVKNNIYRGFSIGGKVTKRNPDNRKIIEGVSLSEISLVDRPANASSVFEMWKADVSGHDEAAADAAIDEEQPMSNSLTRAEQRVREAQARIAVLEGEREVLLKTVNDLIPTLELATKVINELADMPTSPASPAAAATSKAAAPAAAPPAPSMEQIQRAMEDLSPADRQMILIKASLKWGRDIKPGVRY